MTVVHTSRYTRLTLFVHNHRCRTVFVCVMLGAGALFFSRDAHDLVLKPIERMVRKVREVSENPLKRFQVDDSDSEDDDRDRVGGGGFKKRSGGFFSKSKSKEAAGEQMETRLLENSIAKICGLLAVGFGEAGSEIIAHNIRQGGAIDPMIPGRKMVAIFGFCDIRQFTVRGFPTHYVPPVRLPILVPEGTVTSAHTRTRRDYYLCPYPD